MARPSAASVGRRAAARLVDSLLVTDAVTLANPTVGQAARRELLVVAGAIPFAGPVLAAIGWGTVVVSARRHGHGRGWHDRFAGTAVTARTGPPEGS